MDGIAPVRLRGDLKVLQRFSGRRFCPAAAPKRDAFRCQCPRGDAPQRFPRRADEEAPRIGGRVSGRVGDPQLIEARLDEGDGIVPYAALFPLLLRQRFTAQFQEHRFSGKCVPGALVRSRDHRSFRRLPVDLPLVLQIQLPGAVLLAQIFHQKAQQLRFSGLRRRVGVLPVAGRPEIHRHRPALRDVGAQEEGQALLRQIRRVSIRAACGKCDRQIGVGPRCGQAEGAPVQPRDLPGLHREL